MRLDIETIGHQSYSKKIKSLNKEILNLIHFYSKLKFKTEKCIDKILFFSYHFMQENRLIMEIKQAYCNKILIFKNKNFVVSSQTSQHYFM